MADKKEQYPEDEFDILARERGLHGAHRKIESSLRWWVTLLVVIVVAVALGWGGVAVYTKMTAPSQSTSAPAQSESEANSDKASEEPAEKESEAPAEQESAQPSEQPSEETQPQTPEPAPVDYSAQVSVLNASGLAGLAGSNQYALQQQNFTNVQSGNFVGTPPQLNTVYYASPELESTAKAVAAALSIPESQLVQDAGVSPNGITVVLMGR